MSRSLSRLQAILLGLVVLVGLSLASVGVFAVGKGQWLWSDTFPVTVGFGRIRGVEAGTEVRVQGVKAGVVEAIVPPATPGGDVILRLKLSGQVRNLIRSDASVQIVSEGMIGGKVLEIDPGTPSASPVADNAQLASRPTPEITDVLGQVNTALDDIRQGQGTLGKLLKDPQAYSELLALIQQSKGTMASFQQDADAIKSMPIVRNYVEDADALLIRPNCERNRCCYAETDLFEPGRAVLTADGRRLLDEVGPWLGAFKQKGSEVVVVSYADAKQVQGSAARTLTKMQSEAVCEYLKGRYSVQKLGWFTSRKVAALGLGTSPPPVPEKEPLPPARVEIMVFVPQG
jgi:phospholipid/cholesterol/gamma-HCH transport system substrate-binding protein